MKLLNKDMFSVTGTNTASVTIPSDHRIICTRLGWDSPGAGTLVLYRASYRTKANAAVSNSTTLVIDTDASGTCEGYTITTNDYVLVSNDSGTGTAWYLQSVSTVGAVSSSTRSLVLGGAIYCSADAAVYIVPAAQITTWTTAAESVRNIQDAFCSFKAYPVHLLLTATGTCRFNGSIDIYA